LPLLKPSSGRLQSNGLINILAYSVVEYTVEFVHREDDSERRWRAKRLGLSLESEVQCRRTKRGAEGVGVGQREMVV
jgi:hypothetical protein